jgi:putative spermidine/putrescine transport system permease protein
MKLSVGRAGLVLTAFVWLFFAFLLAPILVVVAVSFTSAGFVSFPIPGVSTRWFQHVWAYKPFVDAFLVSLEVAAAATILSCLLGVPACLALARSRSRIADALITFMLAPLSMPMIVLGFASLFFLSRFAVGLGFPALVIVHTIVCLPYVIRTVAGTYRGVPPSLEEAAAILGASRVQVFGHVVLPLIRPGIVAGALFSFLVSFDNLPISFFLGTAQTNTLPVVMLSYLQAQFDPSIAALSTVQLALALVALVVIDRSVGIARIGLETAPG